MNRTYYTLGVMGMIMLLSVSCESEINNSGLVSNGQAGSMARFAIAEDYLYTVGIADMQLFDISEPGNPLEKGEITAGINIETIFAYQSNLFIGSQTGMYIYDISAPSDPRLLSIYEHIVSCDPVVAQGNYAYVTMRDGQNCRFGSNQLDVIDISNLTYPEVVSSTPMLNPHGLAIADTILYVCEGDEGFKVLNVKDPKSVQEVAHISGVFGYDVIVKDSLLILTGRDGIFQYDISHPENPELLSQILIARK